MTISDDYLNRVRATIQVAAEYVSEAEIAEALDLVDNIEPGYGLYTLAWAIVSEDVRVPASVLRDIMVLSEDLMPADDFPPTWMNMRSRRKLDDSAARSRGERQSDSDNGTDDAIS
ncbi:MAG: hypothetical protein LBI84_08745 [Propionibacteriaceae bacterium]|jgi:hypothetical protein|nr:hypothetical protein [Propionibacteriaceae bacterium]